MQRRKNKLAGAAALILTAVLLPGCGQTAVKEDTAAATTMSEAVQADKTPENVVALSKSNASLWLLAGGKLAGTTDDAMGLEGITDDVTDLGDMDSVSAEAVLDLSPDLVILFSTDPSQNALGEQLKDLGLNVAFMNIDNFADYADVMKSFTDLTGRDDLYEKNVTDVQSAIDQVIEKVPEDQKGQTYLTLRVSATKNKVLKGDDFTTEIFDNLSMVNVAEDTSALDDMSLEAISDADPDWIFVIPRGKEEDALQSFSDQFETQDAWSELSAVKNNHVVILPRDLFGLKPNNRWAESYQKAFDTVYGSGIDADENQ